MEIQGLIEIIKNDKSEFITLEELYKLQENANGKFILKKINENQYKYLDLMFG